MTLKAAIFDMDGLMINTEPLQSQAYGAVLHEYGIEPTPYSSGVIQKVGVREDENWEMLKEKYHLNENTKVLIDQRYKVYDALLRKNLHAQPGLEQLLELLATNHIPMGVASSSPLEHIHLVLNGLKIEKYFSAITSSFEVPHGKPSPDVYLKAVEKLSVEPDACIVFEDAESGVTAAKAAGMKVIAVPNEFTKDQDVSKADNIVSSLQDVTWEMIEEIFS